MFVAMVAIVIMQAYFEWILTAGTLLVGIFVIVSYRKLLVQFFKLVRDKLIKVFE